MATSLHIDPTRQTMLRNQAIREVAARFNQLARDITRLVATEDAFGLSPSGPFALNAASKRWAFLQDPDKLEAFQGWLQNRIDNGLLKPDAGTPVNQPWLSKNVYRAYKAGATMAYKDAKKAISAEQKFLLDREAEHLGRFLRKPQTLSSIRLLYMRQFTQLKGITDSMSARMSQILAAGFADGKKAKDLAAALVKATGINRYRAETIALTEISNAHSNGMLDSFDDMGVGGVVIMAEWQCASGACNLCTSLKGVILTIQEARGLLPRHPRCVTGDTRILSPSPMSIMKSKYTGQIIEIVTTKGRRLSVTANHVLLTQRGWVRAESLTDSDYLLDTTPFDGSVFQRPYDDESVPCIADVFRAASELGTVGRKTTTNAGPEDFHGDGKSITSEVEIQLTNGFLWSQGNAHDSGKVGKVEFVPRCTGGTLGLDGNSALSQYLIGLAAASDSFMGFQDIGSVLLRGSLGYHEAERSGLVSKRNSGCKQASSNGTAVHLELDADGLDGLPALVQLSNLLNQLGGTFPPASDSKGLPDGAGNPGTGDMLSQRFFVALELGGNLPVGHTPSVEFEGFGKDGVDSTNSRHVVDLDVYDVETQETMYIANGVLSSNCKCSFRSVDMTLPAEKGQVRSKANIRKAFVASMKAETREKTAKAATKSSRWKGASLQNPKTKRRIPVPRGPLGFPVAAAPVLRAANNSE